MYGSEKVKLISPTGELTSSMGYLYLHQGISIFYLELFPYIEGPSVIQGFDSSSFCRHFYSVELIHILLSTTISLRSMQITH